MPMPSSLQRDQEDMQHRSDPVPGGTPSSEEATYARVTWRLIPFLFLCYVVAYLDRVNIGFAKLQMLHDLRFSETTYGLGAGIFFIGYFFFEVPSNLFLSRFGARVWIARIMVTWGIISGAMMFVTTPASFYVLRSLLGLAEAGLFPGVILYLTYWYPSYRRGRMVALFYAGVPVAGVIGGPLSGWILQSFNGVKGLAGWQWLFLLEALPSIVMGVAMFFYLDDGIRAAKWLDEDQKQMLERNIEAESGHKEDHSVLSVLLSGKVWFLSLIHFCFVMGIYGIGFWLPSIIKATGVKKPLDIGLLTMIPYATSVVAMILVSRSSDRRRERRWHLALAATAASAGLIFSTIFGDSTVLSLAGLALAAAGIISILPLFWSLPTAFLGGTAAAAAIALINSVGNLAGFVSPYLVGWIMDLTHSTRFGMYTIAASLLLGAVLTLTVPARLVNR
jgi:D-galactonate transporter